MFNGCKRWNTKLWITLDNSVVVGDLSKCIQNQGKIFKQDNKDIWNPLSSLIKERAERGTIKVTWAKGHATEEHITSGITSHEETARNKAVDNLATE